MTPAECALRELVALEQLRQRIEAAERSAASNFVDGVPLPLVKDRYAQRAALAWRYAAQVDATVQPPPPEPCPRGADKPEALCTNRHQCWEPCGELGKDERFAVAAGPEHTAAVDAAVKGQA